MPRLPVSGLEVDLRALDGADDVILSETSHRDMSLALALLRRVASAPAGAGVDWADLPVTDVDALVLWLRIATSGNLLRAEARCQTSGCGALLDINFPVSDYLAAIRPRVPHTVRPTAEASWFSIAGTVVTFRVPTAADLLAVSRRGDRVRALRDLCVRPADAPARIVRRIETALESMAPPVARELAAQCPECSRAVTLYFDPVQFVLRELGEQAAFVYEDVHLLARHYGWSEQSILALPRARRAQYAEMVRHEGRTA